MRRTSRPGADAAEAAVTIGRPVEEVFRFYRDFRNLPRFLGDVLAIEQTGPKTYRWTVQGPMGIRINWTARVTGERANEFIGYETAPLPGLRTTWAIHLSPASRPGTTEVREVMTTPFGRVGRAGLALIGKPPAAEVSANLRRLKELLETGAVSDTSHAVAGKFTGSPHPGDGSGRPSR
jgi:uncharacterized membrane protein